MTSPRSVLIVGGGSAGWMSAAALSRAFGSALEVTVLEDPAERRDSGTLIPFEATLPSLAGFNASLGLDEPTAMKRAHATFRLGTRFRDWLRRDHDYIHPFSEVGAALDGLPFHQWWLRLKAAGVAPPLEGFALAAVAGRLSRFGHPSDDPRSVTSTLSYGMHLDVPAYVAMLREVALQRGVAVHSGIFAESERSPDGSGLAAVRASDGRRLEADLFIDATGQDSALIGGLGADWVDYDRWLPADRIGWSRGEDATSVAPLTEAKALRAGWRLRVPLRDGAATAHVWASAFGDRADADQRAFRNRRRSATWIGNCVAIGLSAVTLEPLEASGLHLVQSGVSKLIGLFPAGATTSASAAEYNRLMAAESDRLRDLMILHYRANARMGEPLWDAARAAVLPEELAHKIRMFESRGRISLYDEETFEDASWVSVFLGQNVMPRRHHPLADRPPLDEVRARLERMRAVIAKAAEAMPAHAEALSHSDRKAR